MADVIARAEESEAKLRAQLRRQAAGFVGTILTCDSDGRG